MNILVCVKRVPATAGHIALSADGQEIDTRYLGFTVSPHEECAVEEAVRLIEKHGGSSTVLTLGSEAAIDQLRDAMALGIERAILLETDGREWDPVATASAIVEAIESERAAGRSYDLLMFGNESADSAGYQIGVRVADALDLPCVTGIKALEVSDGTAMVRRQTEAGWETAELPLPAVLTVKEGINLPRYPSLPGRLKAKKKDIERIKPQWQDGGLEKIRLKLPVQVEHTVEVLGKNGDAGVQVVELLQRLRLL
ncbi:MAG TPA: electron transfer flavoprotein subunit beta/FixA family protein [Candidatus Dormibacteraeota bacterium]|jgi:electron transfer flavoprotein beta subunit|nr:electron transfer flavoprotein subunit beta/FixA family protein [Candidatus Dormibacteraeota bacterium]